MKIFNKVIVILLLVCIAFFCMFSIVNEFAGFFDWSLIGQKVLDPAVDINPYISTLVLLFIFIISIFILILEFYPGRSRTAIISSSKSGYTMITIDTVCTQIKNSVNRLDGIEDLKIRIDPKSKGIIINMSAKLSGGLDLPARMQEIIREAASAASEKLGIKTIMTNLTIAGLSKKKPDADAAIEETEEIKPTPVSSIVQAEQTGGNSGKKNK
ncbi:MAG: alkaline shock response membrane anchor protein AmaP [Actinobacteria bacterium]|nr:alkaline shock response membrane anchor protein AmaP [Actinomycetota bacterium]